MISNTGKAVVVIGLVISLMLIIAWTNELKEIKVGVYLPGSRSIEGFWINGRSPEEAAEMRAAINSKYGLYLLLVVVATALFFYMVNQEQKSEEPVNSQTKDDFQTQESNVEGLEEEIAKLKSKLEELERLKEN